ncbi:hypothetical protein Lmor_1042 [Legionella moravica]|uniref:Uncharacterized protein n=1 Tax=Legionella moravica TaxID=39962 RepID=A0A378JVY0_9GAMM|nr:OTU domain-containing protein [Legionella moravica]KTD35595.1 hypothetical protein Lmor_1042 [Legionella moravica]STX62744.1 Uncharacterised protein [Legionella moravica]
MLEKEEISLYEKAAENDLNFIKKFILEHPDDINRPCQYPNFRTFRNVPALFNVSVMGLGALVTLVPAPLIAWGLIASMAHTSGKAILDDGKNSRNRKNWTLLDYAAEAGATDVAVWLITQGADITSTYFIDLARANGHHNFIGACESVMATLNDLVAADNELTQVKEMLANVEESLDLPTVRLLSKRFKLTELRGEFASVVERYKRLKLFVDENGLWDEFEQSHAPVVEVNDDTLKNPRLFLEELERAISYLSNIIKSNKLAQVTEKTSKVLGNLKTKHTTYKAQFNSLIGIAPGSSSKSLSAPVERETFFAQPSVTEKYVHPSKYLYGLTEIKNAPYEPGDCFLDAVIALLPADKYFDDYGHEMSGKCYDSVIFYHSWQQTHLKKDNSYRGESVERLTSPYRQWLKQLFRKKVYEQLGSSEDYKNAFVPQTIPLGVNDEKHCDNLEDYRNAISTPLAYFDELAIRAFCDSNKIPVIVVEENSSNKPLFYGEEHYFKSGNLPLFIGHVNGNHFVPLRQPADKSLDMLLAEMGISKNPEEANQSAGLSI